MALSGMLVFLLSTAGEAFQLLLSIGAGTGLLYLLRWFWWRINAWSEIAAMAASFAFAVALLVARRQGLELSDHAALAFSVTATTLVWIGVTLATPPTDVDTLRRFYRTVRPAGRGWVTVLGADASDGPRDRLGPAALGWVLGCTFVYSALFATGALLYGQRTQGLVCLVVAIGSGFGLARLVPRLWRSAEPRRNR